MAQGGWNTTGSLLLCAAFVLCLLSPNFHFGGHSTGVMFVGSFQTLLFPFFAISVAWFGVRNGDRWAWWTCLLGLLSILAFRLATDPGCTVKIFWQHGCHQFMIGIVLGVVGLVLARD